MNETTPSPPLAAALRDFGQFLLSDDADRSSALERSGPEVLAALVSTVDPLYGEIHSLLDVLGALPHPLPEAQATLEDALSSLAQATMEAETLIV